MKRGGGEGKGLAGCPCLHSPSALFLLSLPLLMSCDVQRQGGHGEVRGGGVGDTWEENGSGGSSGREKLF